MQNSLQFTPNNDLARAKVPSAYKWKIMDIFPDDSTWKKACSDTLGDLDKVTAYKGKLKTKTEILACLQLVDKIEMQLEKIYPYARLQKDADGTDNKAQELTGKAEVLLNNCNNTCAFLEPELLALEPSLLTSLAQDKDFSAYHQFFTELLRKRSHVLSIPEETLLAQSTLTASAPGEIFHTLVGADFTFPPAKDAQGQDKPVSEGSYLLNMTAPDRTLRSNTFSALMGVYKQHRNTLAATLNAQARTSYFYAKAHKYADTRANALDEENISANVYDELLATVEKNLPALHEYMALKKSALKLTELHPYDIYLPLTAKGGETFHFTFEEAKATVLEALKPLGATYCHDLNNGLEHGWVDIYENKGKRSGAYSWGVYGVHPYVLMNFQPRYNSVTTLAHEMGHSMHSFYSSQAQPFPTAEYTIFCAEVASTTNEVLLLEHMLKKANKEQKIFLLNQFLEAVRTTVYRQTQFAELEKIFHNEITEGRTLTADYMENLWHRLNVKYYGSAFTVDPLLDSEWSRIPHFYTPFYVYKYATGYSCAMAFAEQILSGDQEKVNKYLGFLQAGGSDYSLNILKKAGVDLTTPAPVQTTLDKFAEKLAELKELLG
jgi:oligoendopeptidase F